MKKFDRLLFKVHDVPHGTDLITHFGDMKHIKEFAIYPHADRNKVIRFVIYCYDFNSELIKEYKGDLKARREKSAELAGFKRNTKGEFDQSVQDFMDLTIPETREYNGTGTKRYPVPDIIDMVIGYLKFQNNDAWMEIVALQHSYYDNMKNIMKQISGNDSKSELDAAKKRGELLTLNQSIKIMLKNAQKEFYVEDYAVEEKHERKRKITPENIFDFDLKEYL